MGMRVCECIPMSTCRCFHYTSNLITLCTVITFPPQCNYEYVTLHKVSVILIEPNYVFVRLPPYTVCQCPTEPDYEFDKPLEDTDAFEKETAEFKCEVSDKDARVQWFLEDKVGGATSPRQTKMITKN